MNINFIEETDAIELIRHLLKSGLRSFHTSYEYESFSFFKRCILKSLELEKVDPNTILYTVKLASPSFDETEINIDQIFEKINLYKNSFETNKIQNIQWMLRSKIDDEKLRLKLLEKDFEKLNKIIKILKEKKIIKEFSCFPYTYSFAKLMYKLVKFDNFIEYCSVLENYRFNQINSLVKNKKNLIAIRPFYAGKTFENNISIKQSFEFLNQYSSLESVIVSTNNKTHFSEIVKYAKV